MNSESTTFEMLSQMIQRFHALKKINQENEQIQKVKESNFFYDDFLLFEISLLTHSSTFFMTTYGNRSDVFMISVIKKKKKIRVYGERYFFRLYRIKKLNEVVTKNQYRFCLI